MVATRGQFYLMSVRMANDLEDDRDPKRQALGALLQTINKAILSLGRDDEDEWLDAALNASGQGYALEAAIREADRAKRQLEDTVNDAIWRTSPCANPDSAM
jgi:hypothetical protein